MCKTLPGKWQFDLFKNTKWKWVQAQNNWIYKNRKVSKQTNNINVAHLSTKTVKSMEKCKLQLHNKMWNKITLTVKWKYIQATIYQINSMDDSKVL